MVGSTGIIRVSCRVFFFGGGGLPPKDQLPPPPHTHTHTHFVHPKLSPSTPPSPPGKPGVAPSPGPTGTGRSPTARSPPGQTLYLSTTWQTGTTACTTKIYIATLRGPQSCSDYAALLRRTRLAVAWYGSPPVTGWSPGPVPVQGGQRLVDHLGHAHGGSIKEQAVVIFSGWLWFR